MTTNQPVTLTVTAGESDYLKALIEVDEGQNAPKGVRVESLYRDLALSSTVTLTKGEADYLWDLIHVDEGEHAAADVDTASLAERLLPTDNH